MVKFAFILTCGVVLGALLIENKHYFSHHIPTPIAELPDAGVYDGKLYKGRFHGQGRISWPSKSYYEGGFKEGLFHGEGLLHTPTSLYQGDFVLGQATGEGTINYVSGGVYKGGVISGLANGQGVLTTKDREYKGEFKNDQFHGYGELTEEKGVHYAGSFEAGLFHGEGVYTQTKPSSESESGSEKEVYTGNFIRGAFSGQGVWTKGEQQYEGEFLQWRFHGNGVYTDEKGVYVGEFVDGVYQGKGKYISHQGLEYEGNFLEGYYHGKGVLTDSRGDRYVGDFQYGAKHGDGELTYAEELDGIKQVKGVWAYGNLVSANHPRLVVEPSALAEHALYRQPDMLRVALASVEEQNPDTIDLYFVGIAGDGSQGVFRREMAFVKQLFDSSYGTSRRSISLVNSPLSYDEIPLATVTSIKQTLQTVAEKMDPNNDILFVYLTSHGSRDFELKLFQPGLSLPSLSAEELGRVLKALPVHHKVVVISACFSGGFIPEIKDPTTLVVTAASMDKTSFGCHDRAKMTYFGEAFFKDALHQSESFVSAFDRARDIVRGREAKAGVEYSEPLIFKPKQIVAQLKKWRQQFVE